MSKISDAERAKFEAWAAKHGLSSRTLREAYDEAQQAALAATVQQQVGEHSGWNAVCKVLDDLDPNWATRGDPLDTESDQAVAAIRQLAKGRQFGEGQGDAPIKDAYIRHFGGDGGWLDKVGSGFMEGYQAALASRQPVVELAAVVSGETYSNDGTSDIIKPNLPIGTNLYAAPPAQAVDLGQFWEPIKEAVHTALATHAAALSEKKRELVAVYVARQLRGSSKAVQP